MISKASTVAAYLREVPAERRPALRQLRALCRASLPGFTEKMMHGGPVYLRDGYPAVGFASQKHGIHLYFCKTAVVAKHRHRLAGISMGKCCIRYSRPERMDFVVIAD